MDPRVVIANKEALRTEIIAAVEEALEVAFARLDRAPQSLAIPISDLDLSARAMNCLREEDIWTINDLIKWSPTALLRIRSLGEKTLKEIEDMLETLDLSLPERSTKKPTASRRTYSL